MAKAHEKAVGPTVSVFIGKHEKDRRCVVWKSGAPTCQVETRDGN